MNTRAWALGAELRKCFEIAAGRPAFALALRAATATTVPLVIGVAVGQPLFGWMSVGGWLCAIADPGGSYPVRTQAMVSFAAAAALATGLGTAASSSAPLSIGLLFAGAVVASLARAGGETAGSVGMLALVLLCIASGWSVRPELAGPRLLMALGGCAVSTGLALLPWPLRAYQQARRRVSSRYRDPSELPRPTERGAIAFDSPVVRHAALMAVTVSAGAAIAAWMGIAPGFWVTVTVVIVLQPDFSTTGHRVFHYLLGTVLGAGVAVLLMPALRSPTLIGLVLFPLSALAVAVRALNYGLFILLVTPVYLMMIEVLTGDFHLATARILNVLVGCGLALAAQLVTRSSPR